MARPIKNGLAYFPFDCDFFDDDKIVDLLDAHGTAGVTVYIAILCLIYRNGCSLHTDVHRLARAAERKIGNRWLKNNLTEKIIHTIISLGLLDSGFAMSGVITSTAVQRRHLAAVTSMRRKANMDEYCLLSENEENDRALESAPKNRVSSEEMRVSSEEAGVYSEEMPIKENKRNITTTTTIKPPSFHEIHEYFAKESLLDTLRFSPTKEAKKFEAYNANRGWDCLPDWKEAADLWAVRAEEKGE